VSWLKRWGNPSFQKSFAESCFERTANMSRNYGLGSRDMATAGTYALNAAAGKKKSHFPRRPQTVKDGAIFANGPRKKILRKWRMSIKRL
jgi:hypothetical protein